MACTDRQRKLTKKDTDVNWSCEQIYTTIRETPTKHTQTTFKPLKRVSEIIAVR